MKLKFIVAAAVMTAMPMSLHAQNAPKKPTKAEAQRVVQTISGDKAKTAKYCEIAALGEEMEAADQKKDTKKVDELSKKADDLAKQVGADYAALVAGLESIDPNSKDGKDIAAVLDGLDKLCEKK